MEQIINSKVCSKCKIEKSSSEFSKNKNTKDGLQYECKVCTSERQRQKQLQPVVLTEEQNSVTKVCTKCKEDKIFSEFNKHKNRKFGLAAECKECMKQRRQDNKEQLKQYRQDNKEQFKQYRQDNKEHLSEYQKRYRQSNKEKISEQRKQYRQSNKEKISEQRKRYRESNKKKISEYHKQLYQSNKEQISERNKRYCQKPEAKARRNKRQRDYYKANPKLKLDHNMSNTIWKSLKKRGSSKGGSSWLEYVDYTIDQLAEHLEKQFDDKMTWENQGTYWHIDHIIPVSRFNYSSPHDEEFKKCWALSNLQPLEKLDNISKGAKTMEEWLEYKNKSSLLTPATI